jgi:DNA-directed RNA polymerase subunit RPC12/RpoP
MAMGTKYVCGSCKRAIMAWDDGNPYYIDEAGAKRYAYHPDHENLDRCIGNDSPHLCLACGEEFMVDSRSSLEECPKCRAADIVDTFDLKGRRCPYCKAGVFGADSGSMCIS